MPADPSSTAAPSPNTPYTATSRTPAPQPPPEPTLAQINPHLFDIVPSLERLLARLLIPAPGITAPDGSSAASAAEQDKPEHLRHLDIQQLDAAANAIRVQIQKARAGVAQLPDMDRTVEEQQEEIDWLEGRIARQKEMLRKTQEGFDEDARKSKAEDAEREAKDASQTTGNAQS